MRADSARAQGIAGQQLQDPEAQCCAGSSGGQRPESSCTAALGKDDRQWVRIGKEWILAQAADYNCAKIINVHFRNFCCRYKSHDIEFIIEKCAIQWHLVISRGRATIATI